MNAALQSIFRRRSVRVYENRSVPDNLIHDLLEAAMAAPSAVAKDPWHFIVVREQKTRDALANGLPNGQMLRQAPLGMIVCGDLDRAHDRLLSYLIQDCSAAIENILLAAAMLGLGGCWLGIHPREERIAHVRHLFALPEHILPVSAIAIGWPSQQPAPRTRYREDAVHREQW